MRKFVLVAWLALAGCEKDNLVQVECNPALNVLTCSVQHTQGSRSVNACWTVSLACSSGTPATASACQVVAPSSRVSKIIPESQIQNLTQCGQVLGMSIQNLVLTVQ